MDKKFKTPSANPEVSLMCRTKLPQQDEGTSPELMQLHTENMQSLVTIKAVAHQGSTTASKLRNSVRGRSIRALMLCLAVLLGGIAAYADYPGIAYNFYVDFEAAVLGVAPSPATLGASTHGTGATWTIVNPDGALTVVSGAQSQIAGSAGNRGLQYSDAQGRVDYALMKIPTSQPNVSIGMWYCTSTQPSSSYGWEEGIHFVGFYNDSVGDMWRLSDERNSVDNTREIRLSPTGPDAASLRRIPVQDNTCYWIAFKFAKGDVAIFNLYDTNLNLLGSVSTPEDDINNVESIWLGNHQKTSANLPYTAEMDDIVVDYTNAVFPLLPKAPPPAAGAVTTFAGNAQHTSDYIPSAQDLARVEWSANLNASGSSAPSHYGSPLITAANTVVAPVETATGGFQLNAYNGANGAALYTLPTDYVAPTSAVTTAYQGVLAAGPSGIRLYYPGAGGTVNYIVNPDSATPSTPVREVFYTTLADYQSRSASFNSTVFINTPITADTNGNIFFGFRVQGNAPAPLSTTQDGFARIDPSGNATYVITGNATSDAAATHASSNVAPALSNDQATVYVAAKSASTENYGYLLGLDSTTLATKYRAFLTDPRNGSGAGILESSTASPTIGLDNDVYFGVTANPDNGSRGFLLHFSSDLATQKIPGEFGWDNTVAIVPVAMVPSYTGTASYLLLSNYNNYAGTGNGDGVNKVALLDPTASQIDPQPSANGLPVMQEVLTINAPTPDAASQSSSFPAAVSPWDGNASAVNAATNSVFLNSSDGNLYRWNTSTNSISQFLKLGAASNAPYVPTVIGPDGAVYSINNGTLFDVGGLTGDSVNVTSSSPDERSAAASQSLTFTATVANSGTSGTIPTGSVTFQDTVSTVAGPGTLTSSTSTLGSVSLDPTGRAILGGVSLAAGSHFITAVYGGDGNFATGTGGMVQLVHANASSVAVSSAPNPSAAGQAATFSIAVTPVPAGAGIPSGQVTLSLGTTKLAQLTLDQNGLASYTSSSLPIGTSSLSATYSSDSFFASSLGSATQTVVSALPTTTSLTSTLAPAPFGQSVTLTAIVASSSGVPTGTVTFVDGVNTLASNVALDGSGQATFTTTTLAVGSHSLTATYSGSGVFAGSNGSLTELVQSSTTTVLNSSANPSAVGQPVTFTATVTGLAGTPTGTVSFLDGATTLASNVTVNAGGIATFTTSALAAGTHNLTANFNGTGGYTNSNSAAAAQTVLGSTAATLTSSLNPASFGQSVTFTATISNQSGVPTGTVNFLDGATVLSSNVAVNASGVATFSSTTLAVGNHAMSATFTGTGGFPNSNASLSQLIQSTTATALASSVNPATPGQSVTLTATITGASGVPTGTVTFLDGATTLASNVPVSGSGVATFSTTSLGVGTHSIAANFTGTNGYGNSAGSLTQQVQGNSLTALASTANPAAFGQAVTFNATVTASSGTPTGTVTFADGATVLASNVPVDGTGHASFGTAALSVGTHAITASFTGTGGYSNSSGNLSQDIQVSTTTAVTTSGSPSTFGQSVTITATASSAGGVPTGTITFLDGATVLASGVAVNASGSASFTTSALSVSTHALSANFTGGGGYGNSSGNASQSVQGSTATSVGSSLNPSTVGQSVTFTATVSSAAGTPAGSVTFSDGGTTLASNVPVNGAGTASFTTAALGVGTHAMSAAFTGTSSWLASTGGLAQQVNQLSFATSVGVTSTPNPATFSQPVSFTASVSSTGGTPSGSVTFLEGSTVLASNLALDGTGNAVFTISTLSVGSHIVTASFAGANGFANSSGTAPAEVIQSAANPGFPGIAYDAWFDFEQAALGTAPTLATLASSTHGTAGSWQIVNNSGSLSVVSSAQDKVAGAPGNRGLQYSTASSDPADLLEWTPPQSQSQVSLGMYYCTSNQSAPNYAYVEGPHFLGFDSFSYGNMWRLSDERNSGDNTRSIRVSPSGPDNPVKINVSDNTCYWIAFRYIKSGNVDFSLYDTSLNLIQHVSLVDTIGLNVDAIWVGNNLPNGDDQVNYTFQLDDLIVDYTNAVFPLLPTQSAPIASLALTSTANPSTSGQSVTLTASLTGASGGSVTFTDGGSVLASNVAVNGTGQAAFATAALQPGGHNLAASYTGTGGVTASATLLQTVQTATSANLTSTLNPSASGQAVTFTAVVTSATGTPTGTVTFSDGASNLASNVTLDVNGQAAITTSALAAGTHTISVNFTATGAFANASASLTQVVQNGSTTTSFSSSPNPSASGQSVSFPISVTSAAGIPTGTVAILDGATTLASGISVNGSGQATFSSSALGVGSHAITVNFTGTGGFSNSTATGTQNVQATTSTAATSSVNPATPGQSVTLTATVTSTAGTPSGTVSFVDGATPLASNIAVNASGVATFSTTSLAVGAHPITVNFTGTGGYQNSAGTLTETVQGNTLTAVSSTANPATFGQSITITAALTSSGGTPTGTVTFTDGASTLASGVTVDGTGHASVTTSALAAGTHAITANFTASGAFSNSSGSLTQVIQASTATALGSSANPSTFSQSVTFTAAVTSTAGTPTGTVTFSDGANTLASNVAVNASGLATFTTTTLTTGAHTITANFAGSGGFTNSSGVLPQSVQATTASALSSSANPSTPGQSVTFTARVSSAGGTPSGSVTFTDGSTVLASGIALSAGQATLATAALANGTHTITATFTGTGGFGNSAGSVTQVVQGGATATALTASTNPAGPGQSVTFTATVTAGSSTPTGTVTLKDGATTLASNLALNASGQATFTTSTLSVASHTITATFTGTAGFTNSTGTLTESIQGTTTTAVTSSLNPAAVGQSVTLTATITGVSNSPTGTVTFTDGTTTLRSGVAVTAGQATFTTATLAAGSHSIKASFTGTGGFTASSGTLTQLIQASTSTALASSVNPSGPGQSVTLTATVTSASGHPLGTVTFTDGTTTLASNVAVSTNTGRATLSTSTLASGVHALSATFTGNAGWTNSNGTLSETVKFATTSAVSGSPNPQTVGLPVVLTATITSAGGIPTGTVAFTSGATNLGSGIAVDGNGNASVSTSALTSGTKTITVTFTGTGGFANSTATGTVVMQADTAKPSTPSNVAAVSGPATRQITVTWTASTDNVGVTGYQVFRATTANGTFSRVSTGTSTSFTDTSLAASGLTRFYYVVAVDAAGNVSANSTHVSAASK